MSVWMVRCGSGGEFENAALQNGLAIIDWSPCPDVSSLADYDTLKEVVRRSYPDDNEIQLRVSSRQLFTFAHRIKAGDLIMMPRKSVAQIAIGKARGVYKYRKDVPGLASNRAVHTQQVDWVRPDLPRTALGQDLLSSLGSISTVCQISRNDAEKRIRSVLEGRLDTPVVPDKPDVPQPDEEPKDVERLARDQIVSFIQSKFHGHAFAKLVDAVLQAEGYTTRNSPPGPDGGVDILARKGSLGLEGPRLCVQVKSSQSPCDVQVLRALQGTMQTFKADEGLLVCWGGFNSAVSKESQHSFFNVRLWDAEDLLEALFKNYERLSEELQTELPLKRIWTIVSDS